MFDAQTSRQEIWATVCIPYRFLYFFLLSLSGKAHLIRRWLPIVIFFKSDTIWLGGSLNKLAVVVGMKKEAVWDLFISGSRFLPAVVPLDNTLSLVCQSVGTAQPPSDFWYRIPLPCMNLPFFVCRIYNKLPEVTKKKEEEKKRAVSQTNRLRAEVFKKVEFFFPTSKNCLLYNFKWNIKHSKTCHQKNAYDKSLWRWRCQSLWLCRNHLSCRRWAVFYFFYIYFSRFTVRFPGLEFFWVESACSPCISSSLPQSKQCSYLWMDGVFFFFFFKHTRMQYQCKLDQKKKTYSYKCT